MTTFFWVFFYGWQHVTRFSFHESTRAAPKAINIKMNFAFRRCRLSQLPHRPKSSQAKPGQADQPNEVVSSAGSRRSCRSGTRAGTEQYGRVGGEGGKELQLQLQLELLLALRGQKAKRNKFHKTRATIRNEATRQKRA